MVTAPNTVYEIIAATQLRRADNKIEGNERFLTQKEVYQVFALNGYARKGADKWLDEWKELDMVSIRDGIVEILLFTEEMTCRYRGPIILDKEKDTLIIEESVTETPKKSKRDILVAAKQLDEFTVDQLLEACLPLEYSETEILKTLHMWLADGTAWSPRSNIYRVF